MDRDVSYSCGKATSAGHFTDEGRCDDHVVVMALAGATAGVRTSAAGAKTAIPSRIVVVSETRVRPTRVVLTV